MAGTIWEYPVDDMCHIWRTLESQWNGTEAERQQYRRWIEGLNERDCGAVELLIDLAEGSDIDAVLLATRPGDALDNQFKAAVNAMAARWRGQNAYRLPTCCCWDDAEREGTL